MDLEQISTITRGIIIVVGALLTATGCLLLALKGVGHAVRRRMSLLAIIVGIIVLLAAVLI